MSNKEFESVLRRAVHGDSIALEKLLILYEPMIYKYSCVKGKYSEDKEYLKALNKLNDIVKDVV